MAKTSDYYKKNPAARKRRLKQQARYNKTKKATESRVWFHWNNAIASIDTGNMAISTY